MPWQGLVLNIRVTSLWQVGACLWQNKDFFANASNKREILLACIPKTHSTKYAPELRAIFKCQSLFCISAILFQACGICRLTSYMSHRSAQRKKCSYRGKYVFTMHLHCAAALCIITPASHFFKSDHCRKERAQMQWSSGTTKCEGCLL